MAIKVITALAIQLTVMWQSVMQKSGGGLVNCVCAKSKTERYRRRDRTRGYERDTMRGFSKRDTAREIQ